MYFYYQFESNTNKYTSKNKYRKNILDFHCSDILWQAQGYYYREKDKFKPKAFTNYIKYKEHKYTINNIIKDKIYSNKITE